MWARYGRLLLLIFEAKYTTTQPFAIPLKGAHCPRPGASYFIRVAGASNPSAIETYLVE